MKKKAKIDVAVLILFFCRDTQLSKVFESVKMARPSKLYLCQDGARGASDLEKIEACRKIVSDENIDWECEVHRWYREKNVGCDPSGYQAQKWLFDNEGMGIVLEDDVVPSQSFFPFCKELLERYKDNRDISLICGMNNTEVSKHVDTSYLYTKIGGIWGWASWRRFFQLWDADYSWMDDPQKVDIIKSQLPLDVFKNFMYQAQWHRETGKEYFETLYAAAQWINYGYAIVPKYNLITNVGIDRESAHNSTELCLLPKGIQKLFYMKSYEISFPLKHPVSLKRDYIYERKRIPSKPVKLYRKIEHGFRVLRFKGVGEAMNLIKRKIFNKNQGVTK